MERNEHECFNFPAPLSIHCSISIYMYVIVIMLIEPLKCHDTVNIEINVKIKQKEPVFVLFHHTIPFKSTFVARYYKSYAEQNYMSVCRGGGGG